MNKPKIMAKLGSASGCVNRCIDIMQRQDRSLTFEDAVAEIDEMVGKLQKADMAILVVAREIENEPEDDL